MRVAPAYLLVPIGAGRLWRSVSPPPVWRFLPITRQVSFPSCATATQDTGGTLRRRQVQEWGERPHGPGGAEHRAAPQRPARVDGHKRNQLVADAYRPSRWTRVDRYEPNKSVENTKSPGGPFPPGTNWISNARVLHEPRCMPPLRGYSIPERSSKCKHRTVFCGHLGGILPVLARQPAMTSLCTSRCTSHGFAAGFTVAHSSHGGLHGRWGMDSQEREVKESLCKRCTLQRDACGASRTCAADYGCGFR